MLNIEQSIINEILEKIFQELDIPDSRYEEVVKRYESVGNWLGRDESVLKNYNPRIYPQGSFRLGTIIKPINDKDEYDIDLVCELNFSKSEITQKQLKDKVGIEIKSYAELKKMNEMPKNKQRCWTLNYSNEFHMDILPAIPDGVFYKSFIESKGYHSDKSEFGIALTDKTYDNYNILDNEWPLSNPKGYSEWFKEKMRIILNERKMILAKSLHLDIENVPEYKIKTPLQRVVQILKRHRDVYFSDKDNKPISIIITTLAAIAYNNEANIFEALLNIIKKLENIDSLKKDGKYYIPNPVNQSENFADKWNEENGLPLAFKKWIIQVKTDFGILQNKQDEHLILESMQPLFGEKLIKSIFHLSDKENNNESDLYPKIEIKTSPKPWCNLQ